MTDVKGIKKYKLGQFTVRQYPEEYIQLMREVVEYHPELDAIIRNKTALEEQLAEIGAYCNILLDGNYEFTTLCFKLFQKLRSKRSPIILLN